MIELVNEDLDIAKIAASGQCFRIDRAEDGLWEVTARGRLLRVEDRPDGALLHCGRGEYEDVWRDYFDMDTDYGAMRESVDPEDSYLSAAAESGRGIRILRQEHFEALISFIISQRKNIPAIKCAIEAVSRSFGERIDGTHWAFPSPEALAAASFDGLRACSLGYRVPYVKKAAEAVASGELDLDALEALDDEALLKALMCVYGVGVKVANCTMLFGYHRIGAFPVDVWISRVLEREYPDGFPFERYSGYAGVMQQYMFFGAIRK